MARRRRADRCHLRQSIDRLRRRGDRTRERWFDHVGALDGDIDPLAGHGTFIAGLVHQACPDADIVAWRVVDSDGPIVESDWIDALTKSSS